MSGGPSPKDAAELRAKAEQLREILRLIERGAETGLSPPLDMHPDYARLKRDYDELIKQLPR